MIDLHLHLDGSLPAGLIWELMKGQGVDPPCALEQLSERLTVPASCRDLNGYLSCFDLPLLVLQRPEALTKAVDALIHCLNRQGLLYAEIRFAPQLHTRKGMTQREAVEAALKGRSAALAETGLDTRLILCCMRGDGNLRDNMETVDLAAHYLGQGVAAVDLAGAESLYDTRGFADVFKLAARLGVPFTVHAGEAAGPDSIKAALSFGAARIGHGVRAVEDPDLVDRLRNDQVVLEMCPTSNVQTGAAASFAQHPALLFLCRGLAVTVNTDNMTVSGVTISSEMARLRQELGMTPEEERLLYRNAVTGAFLTEPEKDRLRLQLDSTGSRR